MTALKGRAIKAFLNAPEQDIAAILVYGPDAGLVRERAEMLARRVVDDLKDPFNAIELSDADLKDEPGRLADEISALSFAGGERVIRLRTAGEASARAVAALIDGLDAGHVKANGLVVIEGGDLSPRSGVRKTFEKAKRAAALPCYADTPADVRDMAQEAARSEGLRFDEDALDLVVSVLGDDHGLSRAEIDKLILYKGPKAARVGSETITIDDVNASLVDGQGAALDDAAAAAADGAPKALSLALFRAQAAGASPIGLLRSLQRHVARMKAAKDFIDGGDTAAGAMKNLRPPVFFAEQRAFERRLQKWPSYRLETAARLLVEAELEAKTTGAPQREIIERAALRLALMAR
jgi:DNA polymerase-3 subunit delta